MRDAAVQRTSKANPLRERVYAALEEMIIYRALQPGEHIVEAEVARKLGVSRIPVREALALLSRDRWIELRPRQGAFVRRPTLREVDEVFAVRAILEGEAARLAAKNADENALRELDALIERGRAQVHAGDERELVGTNSAFHGRVAELAGNHVLLEMIDRLDKRIRWYFASVAAARGEASWDEHRELVRALRARDPELAAEVTAMHLEMTRSKYHQYSTERDLSRR
jgi:DNA-binding GntR family transcriptional regulator